MSSYENEKIKRVKNSSVVTRRYEGKTTDHILVGVLKTSRRGEAVSALLKELSADFNAFLL